MAEKAKAVDTVLAKQNEAPTVLTQTEKNAVLARRLKAVQNSNNNTPKIQRALNRLAANINK